MPDIEDFESSDAYYNYISALLMLPKEGWLDRSKVKSCKRFSDEFILGDSHYNSLLDTRVYKVEFQGGTTNEYADNCIAKNLYSQTDPDNNEFLILKDIIYHRSTDKSFLLSDAYKIDHMRKK